MGPRVQLGRTNAGFPAVPGLLVDFKWIGLGPLPSVVAFESFARPACTDGGRVCCVPPAEHFLLLARFLHRVAAGKRAVQGMPEKLKKKVETISRTGRT